MRRIYRTLTQVAGLMRVWADGKLCAFMDVSVQVLFHFLPLRFYLFWRCFQSTLYIIECNFCFFFIIIYFVCALFFLCFVFDDDNNGQMSMWIIEFIGMNGTKKQIMLHATLHLDLVQPLCDLSDNCWWRQRPTATPVGVSNGLAGTKQTSIAHKKRDTDKWTNGWETINTKFNVAHAFQHVFSVFGLLALSAHTATGAERVSKHNLLRICE